VADIYSAPEWSAFLSFFDEELSSQKGRRPIEQKVTEAEKVQSLFTSIAV
jgi:hypothetical protein